MVDWWNKYHFPALHSRVLLHSATVVLEAFQGGTEYFAMWCQSFVLLVSTYWYKYGDPNQLRLAPSVFPQRVTYYNQARLYPHECAVICRHDGDADGHGCGHGHGHGHGRGRCRVVMVIVVEMEMRTLLSHQICQFSRIFAVSILSSNLPDQFLVIKTEWLSINRAPSSCTAVEHTSF